MNVLRLSIAGLLAPLVLSQPAAAQALDPTFSPPTSLYAPAQVYTLGPQQADGKRVVSGSFSRINGSPVGRFVRLDAAGALDLPFTQNVSVVSFVYRVRSLPTGQYLLSAGGGGITAGGLSRAELLRLNANGTADASFNDGDGPVVTGQGAGSGYSQDFAVQPDGKVVVVGGFDTFNNVPTAGVVRLNANGSVDTGFGVGTGIDVTSNIANSVVVQPDGKILVAGDFTTFNGRPAEGVVRLNANGSVDGSFASGLGRSQSSYVENLLLQPDGKVLISGYLNQAGTNSPSLLRLLPSGALDPSFAAPAFTEGGSVSTGGWDTPMQLAPNGKILITGRFTAPSANRVARLNADGTQDFTFQVNGGPSGPPTTIGLQADGTVLVGGFFDALNGTEASFGRFTATGAPDAAFAPVLQVPGNVTALVRQADGKLVLGGNFTEVNGQAVHRLARFTAAGALDAGFSAAMGALPPVNCLALQPDGKVLAGTTRSVLRFNPNGSPDTGFTYSVGGATALALQPDGKILAGAFSNLSRLTTTGLVDLSFNRSVSGAGPGTPNYTDAIVVQPDGRIVVGGQFRPSGQQPVARVVRYETTGALDASFNNLSAFTATNGTSNFTNRVYALALQPDGKILAGGNFEAVDGTLHYGVARLSPAGTPDAGFAPNALLTGTVYALAQQPNGRVLLGGSFTNSGAAGATTNLARVLGNGQTDGSFGASATPNRTVRALLVQPDGAIAFGGAFITVGGQPAAGVARITAPNVLAVAAPAAVAARTAAWPVPAHGRLHVAPDASAHPRSVELLDALGRAVRTQPISGAAEVTLDVENLPAGTYLLRVRYDAGTVTRRVAVQ